MIKVCYCNTCGRIFYKTSQVSLQCPKCEENLMLLSVGFEDFTQMSEEERSRVIKKQKNHVTVQPASIGKGHFRR